MKLILLISSLIFSQNLFAAMDGSLVINVNDEIKLIQEKTISNQAQFKVIEVEKLSVFQDMGYKSGDVVQTLNGQKIKNKNPIIL